MFISIVTVVYNGEKTIRRTIESVLCQEFKDYEYIIVDGLSKDNTVAIAKEYEERFEGRLRIYSEKDKGIYDAMNKGIKLAKGDYVWLVNADDYICDNALQELYDYCKSIDFRECVISSGMNLVDSFTNQIKYTAKGGNVESFNKACKKLKMGISHPATIVHREIYAKIGMYDDRYYISADVDFCIRCYREKIPVLFSSLIITNMTDGGISHILPFKKSLHDCNICTSKFCKNSIHRLFYTLWYIGRWIVVKIIGYQN